ncbi:O-antigen ligase family protein [Leifsonia flava]|uniref:O-antigen ligase family protein n=1 Tax=Orlajensenia leifsoniae TaxID=2561933 RepID=A0A4Y9QX41_9MICO|nr:O-antigen ligase family protein [Leifsonia flava]TFV96959.1 O-antigen ligase family protein [Leifsonia flava]
MSEARMNPTPVVAEPGPASSGVSGRIGTVDAVLSILLVTIGLGNLVLPVELQSVGGIDYLLGSLMLVAVLLLFRLRLILKQIRHPALMLLFAATLVPGLVATEPNAYGTQKMLGFGIAFVLLIAPAAFADYQKCVRFMVACVSVLSVGFSLLVLFGSVASSSGRLSVLGMNPIGIARVTALFAIVGVVLLVVGARPVHRILIVLGIVASLVATITTGSRGPLLGVVIAAVLSLMAVASRRRLRPFALVVLAVALGLGYYWLQASANIGFQRVLVGDDSGRGPLYQLATELAWQRPGGIGWGNFAFYAPSWVEPGSVTLYPHNIELEFWLEGGIVALIGLLMLVGTASVCSFRSYREGGTALQLIVFALIVFTVANAQFSSDIVGNRFLWLALGLAFAGHVRLKERPKRW